MNLKHLTKTERLNLIRQRHEKLIEDGAVGELPLTKRDINETVNELDAFKEFDRANKSERGHLTSDEA
jgi:hypothetical protein